MTDRPPRQNYGLDALDHLLALRDLDELFKLIRMAERRFVRSSLYDVETASIQRRISHIFTESEQRDEEAARYENDEEYRRDRVRMQAYSLSVSDCQVMRAQIDALLTEQFTDGAGI